MHKHIFVIIRYSILSSVSGWVISRDSSFDKYREQLFSKERLDLHENLFKNITVPSLVSNADRYLENTTIIVVTSTELPDKYMEELNKLSSKYPVFKILPISTTEKIEEQAQLEMKKVLDNYKSDVCYASVRIDDDDALADGFFSSLINYIEPNLKGHVVSFSKGFYGLFEKGNFVNFSLRNKPKLALGLSHIGFYKKGDNAFNIKTIYGLGNHTKVDERAPIIFNSLEPMYIRTVHKESDTYSGNDVGYDREINTQSLNLSDPRKVFDCFSFLKGSSILDSDIATKYELSKLILRTAHGTILCYNLDSLMLEHYRSDIVERNDNLLYLLYDSKGLKVIKNGKVFYLGIEKYGQEIKLLKNPKNIHLIVEGANIYISFFNNTNFLSSVFNTSTTMLVGHRKAWEVYKVINF